MKDTDWFEVLQALRNTPAPAPHPDGLLSGAPVQLKEAPVLEPPTLEKGK